MLVYCRLSLILVRLCEWMRNVRGGNINRKGSSYSCWSLSAFNLFGVFRMHKVWLVQHRARVKCTWKWCAPKLGLWEFHLHWLEVIWKHFFVTCLLNCSSVAQNWGKRIADLLGDCQKILERHLPLVRHSMHLHWPLKKAISLSLAVFNIGPKHGSSFYLFNFSLPS